MRGPGKYDKEVRAAMESTGGETVLLIVLNGRAGTGFSLASVDDVGRIRRLVPALLRVIADDIEREESQLCQ